MSSDHLVDDLAVLRRSIRDAEFVVGAIRRHREGDQDGQLVLTSEVAQLSLALRYLSMAVCELDDIVEALGDGQEY